MGSDKHLEGGNTASASSLSSPFTDSVITSREGQTSYHSLRQSSAGLHDVQLAEDEDKPSNPMIKDLVYRTFVNPLREDCGNLLANFDSITNKMSQMFNDPLIKSADGFTGEELSKVVSDQSQMSKFSQVEQNSLRILNENSELIFGAPTARLTRQSVVDSAEQLGILKHV
jgi:hypothetical protein